MNSNFKAEFFTENGKPFMKLEFDKVDCDNRTYHVVIHKIALGEFNLEKFNYPFDHAIIKLDVLANNCNEYMFFTETTDYKEMTIEEIEKKLGYKIKIKAMK